MSRPEPTALIAELRGSAEGSTSACASLMRDAADAIERLLAAAAILAEAARVRPKITRRNLDGAVDRYLQRAADGCTCAMGGHRSLNPYCEKNREATQ